MVSEINSLNSESEIASLIKIGKAVVDRGLVVGSGGNLSMLLKGGKEFLITKTGSELDQLDQSSFALMDLDGNIAEGSAKPSSEYRVHLESYRTRKDINTCIHLHPQASIFAAAIGEDIQLVTTDHLYYLRKIIRIPWIAPGTQEVAEATATALKDCNVVILENELLGLDVREELVVSLHHKNVVRRLHDIEIESPVDVMCSTDAYA